MELSYASVSMIFTVAYANNVPVNLNEYKSWLFVIIISNMTVANSKASASLAAMQILSRFSIYWIDISVRKLYSLSVYD